MTMKMNPYRVPAAAAVLPNLAEAAVASKSLSICARFLTLTGLDQLLRGPEHFTVFAPTDEAFRSLAPETLDELSADLDRLRGVLQYHIISGGRESSGFANSKLKTLQGTLLTAAITDDGMRIDHAHTTGRQITCANGVIHPIDAVLMPGYTPPLSAKAREDSAWSGKRGVRQPAKDENWPFLAPRAADKTSDA